MIAVLVVYGVYTRGFSLDRPLGPRALSELSHSCILHKPLAAIINPRRPCEARVTVVVLCGCLSVCLSVCLSATILALQATRRLMCDTNSFSVTRARKLTWRFY